MYRLATQFLGQHLHSPPQGLSGAPDFPKNSSIADFTNITDSEDVVIGPLTTDQFDKATLDAFLTVQFTHHYEILQRTDTLNERLFYIYKVAREFWSVDKLKYNIREQLYLKEGTMPNNFAVTLRNYSAKGHGGVSSLK